METILCIDTPVQMISCTDTDGKITPMRFRFRDRNGELITINIEKIVSADQERSSLGANFICTAQHPVISSFFILLLFYLFAYWPMVWISSPMPRYHLHGSHRELLYSGTSRRNSSALPLS